MVTYHKIQTVFKRDPEDMRRLLFEQYSLPEFEYLRDNLWVFTEKVDGTNIRVMFDGANPVRCGQLRFGGKTDKAQIPAELVSRLEGRFFPQLEKIADKFPEGACLYGEGYGPKIQKGGGNYREDQDFVLFDVKVGPWWLQREDVEDVADSLGLDVVPIIGGGTLPNLVHQVRDTPLSSMWGNFQAEGIVARPATELVSRGGHRIITKLKCRDFR